MKNFSSKILAVDLRLSTLILPQQPQRRYFSVSCVYKPNNFNVAKHYNILPKSVIQILRKYSVNEFHLSISRGIWDERWGSNFVSVSPSGAELWACVDQSWFELTHALSGLFCASLNQLSTNEHFASPLYSYKPLGVSESGKVDGEDLKCDTVGLELVATLTAVFDRSLIFAKRTTPWSIKSILGSEFRGFCSASDSSRVFVLNSYEDVDVNLDSATKLHYPSNYVLAAYSTKDLFPSFVSSPFTVNEQKSTSYPLPLISATKYVTGSGNVRGGVKAVLTNRANFDTKIIYFDLIPWYMQVFFSSLKIYSLNPKTQERELIKPRKFFSLLKVM
ncbi:unnamed protein product [Trichobilharzia regenti]|nr:unnamed protein product [Trichobilharzia regenti]